MAFNAVAQNRYSVWLPDSQKQWDGAPHPLLLQSRGPLLGKAGLVDVLTRGTEARDAIKGKEDLTV